MNEIWANRLIAGTKTWDQVPAFRKEGVKAALLNRAEASLITDERYSEITGEDAPATITEKN